MPLQHDQQDPRKNDVHGKMRFKSCKAVTMHDAHLVVEMRSQVYTRKIETRSYMLLLDLGVRIACRIMWAILGQCLYSPLSLYLKRSNRAINNSLLSLRFARSLRRLLWEGRKASNSPPAQLGGLDSLWYP